MTPHLVYTANIFFDKFFDLLGKKRVDSLRNSDSLKEIRDDSLRTLECTNGFMKALRNGLLSGTKVKFQGNHFYAQSLYHLNLCRLLLGDQSAVTNRFSKRDVPLQAEYFIQPVGTA